MKDYKLRSTIGCYGPACCYSCGPDGPIVRPMAGEVPESESLAVSSASEMPPVTAARWRGALLAQLGFFWFVEPQNMCLCR